MNSPAKTSSFREFLNFEPASVSPLLSPNTTVQSDTAEKFKEILKSNGIQEPVADVIIMDPAGAAENFGSSIKLVTIKFKDWSNPPLNLFVKYLSNNLTLSKSTDDAKFFKKEAVFLTEYVPAAREFCKSVGQEHLIDELYPKCYYGDEKMMVLENLAVDKGFYLLSKADFQDFEAARVALSALAKHHALSRAFIKNFGGSEAFFKKFEYLDFEAFTRQLHGWEIQGGMTETAVKRNLLILEKANITGRDAAYKFLKSIQGHAYDELVKTLKISDEDQPLLVLNHGDYWNNNMMFKKDRQTGAFTGHIMIDFQVTRYGSPCLDLIYYFYTSVKPSVRRVRLVDLLKIYLDVFKITSNELGYHTSLSFVELFFNYRTKIPYGFWFNLMLDRSGIVTQALMSADPAEVKDLKESEEKMDKFIATWIDDHPEERLKLAMYFIDLLEEQNQLAI